MKDIYLRVLHPGQSNKPESSKKLAVFIGTRVVEAARSIPMHQLENVTLLLCAWRLSPVWSFHANVVELCVVKELKDRGYFLLNETVAIHNDIGEAAHALAKQIADYFAVVIDTYYDVLGDLG